MYKDAVGGSEQPRLELDLPLTEFCLQGTPTFPNTLYNIEEVDFTGKRIKLPSSFLRYPLHKLA